MRTQSSKPWAPPTPDKSSALVSLQGVDKAFGDKNGRVQALSDVSFDVREHEFVSLVGPSGCGKSTALSIIAGLATQDAGEVRFKGDRQTAPRREIGTMFQAPTLLPWRSVRRNISLPAEVLRIRDDDFDQRVDDLLELTGLRGFEDHYPHQLSGGMAQRVALCRLLAFDPELLLMDEPFGALDEFTRDTLDNELLRIWQQTHKTIVFVTHSIGEAVYMSDRVIVMSPRPGRVAGVVAADLERPRRREMLRSDPYLNAVFQIRDLLEVAD